MPKFFCQQCHQRIKKKELPRCIRCRLLNYEELKKVAKIKKRKSKMKLYLQEEPEVPEEETPNEEEIDKSSDEE